METKDSLNDEKKFKDLVIYFTRVDILIVSR